MMIRDFVMGYLTKWIMGQSFAAFSKVHLMEPVRNILICVTANKIIGFGGDVNTLPEQVCGQLEHALENLYGAFAYRIKIGRMDLNYAKYVMKLCLYDNPRRIYKL
ncbi:MAG: hypothetical protein Q8930_18070 [Bacillota bacterium]|nr:hypothetical protein [Bacillota bacterium]